MFVIVTLTCGYFSFSRFHSWLLVSLLDSLGIRGRLEFDSLDFINNFPIDSNDARTVLRPLDFDCPLGRLRRFITVFLVHKGVNHVANVTWKLDLANQSISQDTSVCLNVCLYFRCLRVSEQQR